MPAAARALLSFGFGFGGGREGGGASRGGGGVRRAEHPHLAISTSGRPVDTTIASKRSGSIGGSLVEGACCCGRGGSPRPAPAPPPSSPAIVVVLGLEGCFDGQESSREKRVSRVPGARAREREGVCLRRTERERRGKKRTTQPPTATATPTRLTPFKRPLRRPKKKPRTAPRLPEPAHTQTGLLSSLITRTHTHRSALSEKPKRPLGDTDGKSTPHPLSPLLKRASLRN